jgi:hypothetical protein
VRRATRFGKLLVATVVALAGGAGVSADEPRVTLGRPVPFEVLDPPWLDARRDAQLEAASDFIANIDFQFTDQVDASGVSFRNRVVEDAGKTYKAVHYDHGNGLAVADVDGDGRYDIYFLNQVGANELWRNLGGGRFEDITGHSGLALADRISVAASFADIDNDGDPDLYVTSVRAGNKLFENLGAGRFADISEGSGLDYAGHSSGAVFFDFDRDGLLDVYLSNVGQYTATTLRHGRHDGIDYDFYDGFSDAFGGHNFPERTEASRLFRNLGHNKFEDVSNIVQGFVAGWSGDATIIDANDDGWPDIYELNMQGHDQYYENQAGKAFIAKSREVFPKTSWGAMGIKSFDWNNDGQMDIYITDMHSDMSIDVAPDAEHRKSDMQWNEKHLNSGGASIFGNTFFEKRAAGEYAEISDRIGAENYWPWGLSVGDLNADGYQDVFVSLSMNYPFRYQSNTVLINESGKRLRAAEFILGVEPRKDRKTAQPWFDLDCATSDDRDHAMCARADGRPVQVWGAVGSRSSAIFDIDNDGDLDIVSNEFNAAPMILVSNLAQTHAGLGYLKVSLVGGASNRSGIGARITVVAGENRYTQVQDGKSGYLSQSLLPLYFGLNGKSAVDEVQVVWPSGTGQTVRPVAINTTLVITEPAPD